MSGFRFENRRVALREGVRDALGAPVLVLFTGMIGFGAMCRANGLDIWFAMATSFLMFALPGQVVMLEMIITGSSLLAIGLAVSLTSTRFITMAVTLFPQLHEKDRNAKLFASVHMMAMTAWAVSMREFSRIAPQHRLSYFLGLAFPCWLISLPGTALGYVIAGQVSAAVTLGLLFINPLFFLLTFTEVKPWANRLAIVIGCLLGPVFYMLDRDTSLLSTGLVAGSLAYWLDRRFIRRQPKTEVSA
jgi:predicted branched-subunit amino acid permease